MPERDGMEAGVQPLDALLQRHGFRNHDAVNAAGTASGLTHKMMSKARRGRQLTARTQRKILAAVNRLLTAAGHPPAVMDDLFNYRGR